MSDNPGAWYHCIRCGSLFKADANPERRGLCPECGQDPAGDEAREPQAPVRIRHKVRKPRAHKPRRRRDTRKAKALMVFVVIWSVLLALVAIFLSGGEGSDGSSVEPERPGMVGEFTQEDHRLIQDQLDGCGQRLMQFLAASNIAGRAPHVIDAKRTVQRMARFQQFTPIFPMTAKLEIEAYDVLHTPVGRAIETRWKAEDGERFEAVFFEEDGEWKIDWDAFVRAGSESWPLFLAGRGEGAGEFRLLARERIGANGRDSQFIGLVLYATRPGHPGEAVSPSPEIRVQRSTPMGRQLEDAFAARARGRGAFDSKAVAADPADMIRLRVKVTRQGEEERVFQITELHACHWLQLAVAED